jgi:hypothetical protein
MKMFKKKKFLLVSKVKIVYDNQSLNLKLMRGENDAKKFSYSGITR